MPIFSYLAYPVEGGKDKLVRELSALEHCEVIPADNDDVVILVTDAPDQEAENKLQSTLNDLELLQGLSMTFGHVYEEIKTTRKG